MSGGSGREGAGGASRKRAVGEGGSGLVAKRSRGEVVVAAGGDAGGEWSAEGGSGAAGVQPLWLCGVPVLFLCWG